MANLIEEAYVFFANGHVNTGASVSVTGGPAWTNSDRYQIDAEAESPQSQAMMNGPMLQTLLEDRFKLKIHRETREVPVYALAVVEGGPKLQPFQEGSCSPPDFHHPPSPEKPHPLVCGMTQFTDNGFDAPGVTMTSFCDLLSTSVPLGRNVIDETGIAGVFNLHLDLSPTDLGIPTTQPPADSSSIFTALDTALHKVGLKLEPANGPSQFLVIDHVDKPSEN